jgi:hypothetical protein
LLLLSVPGAAPAVTAGDDASVPAILAAAETLFQSMKIRDYRALWRILTDRSRSTILHETEAALRKTGTPPAALNELGRDFETGGPQCRQYWDGFLGRFDPDDALERSRWAMGTVERDRAEILITHVGADRPAVLRMFRERGSWKAGLVETFWEH